MTSSAQRVGRGRWQRLHNRVNHELALGRLERDSMQPENRPGKRDVFMALVAEGRTSLFIDARRTGVIIPGYLASDPRLVLLYGYDLAIPIPDLVVDDTGVRATLSFAQTPH